jgi:putative MATE family efflux protein
VSHPLLTAPIGRSLWRLAGPTTALIVVQICAGVGETWIVSRLGTDALAGYVLVLPFTALMANMANGGMGGSVASALARALGGGRHDDARALLLHALVVALGLALAFTVFAWTVLPLLFAVMGGRGQALHQAVLYSSWWFAGAVLTWVASFLSALRRGSGDTLTPSRLGLLIAPVYIGITIVLTLGVGDWPGIGLVGPAVASIVATAGYVTALALAIRRGKLGFVPALAGVRVQRRLLGEILRIGLIGSMSTLSASVTALLVTALVGSFGTAAIAGYGIGVRSEYFLAPLSFGIGSGLTTMVGVAAGAGDWRRANRVAWVGARTAFVLIGSIGWAIALLAEPFARGFTSDADVMAACVAYLTRVAPFECLFAVGLTLYFASQGTGRLTAPLAASILRMIVATAGGWFAVEVLGLGLNGVFWAMAASLVAYGSLIAGALFVRPWRAR